MKPRLISTRFEWMHDQLVAIRVFETNPTQEEITARPRGKLKKPRSLTDLEIISRNGLRFCDPQEHIRRMRYLTRKPKPAARANALPLSGDRETG
jgi:hypothetical protein